MSARRGSCHCCTPPTIRGLSAASLGWCQGLPRAAPVAAPAAAGCSGLGQIEASGRSRRGFCLPSPQAAATLAESAGKAVNQPFPQGQFAAGHGQRWLNGARTLRGAGGFLFGRHLGERIPAIQKKIEEQAIGQEEETGDARLG